MISRRKLLKSASASAASILLFNSTLSAGEKITEDIGVQHYTWHTFYKRENKQWDPASEQAIRALNKAGYQSFEPSFSAVEQVNKMREIISGSPIRVHSFYINSTLHDPNIATKSIEEALAVAEAAKKLGVKIVVTNPTPIQWNGPETKTDKQLIYQAQKLEELGKGLQQLEIKLAYHTHDAEMKRGAREFHHMLINTSPKNVGLCLDAHWIYRGTEDSEVALFDVLELYADRIVELHLRQSINGIWSETFDTGDIDYIRLAKHLNRKNMHPYLVVEQAVENGTPHSMDAVQAIGKTLDYTKKIFS